MKLPIPLGDPRRPLPARPYRDSALLYGVLAVVLFAAVLLTGGGLAKAILVAGACFLIATAWSWWRFRERQRARQESR